MKNLFYPALLALGMFVSSGCEKDDANAETNAGTAAVKNPAAISTAAELIAAADARYGTNYSTMKSSSSGNTTFGPNDGVKILKGIWTWTKEKGIENGYCELYDCPGCACAVVVTSPGPGPSRTGIPLKDVIINDNNTPYLIERVKEIKSISEFDQDGKEIRVHYEFIK